MKSIVIYYSVSGQTEFVAKEIEKQFQCDVLKVETEEVIPPDVISRYWKGGISMFGKDLPKLKEYTFDEAKYDTVILGFPNWGSNCPTAMKAFLKENPLTDKKIFLYTTYVGRGGTKCLANVAKNFPDSQVIASEKFAMPKRKGEAKISTKMEDWLKKLDME